MPKRAFRNLQKAREAQRQEDNGLPPTAPASRSTSAPATSSTTPASGTGVSVDLHDLSCVDRRNLRQGAMVRIHIRDTLIWTMPPRLLVAASTKGTTIINSNNEVHIPATCSREGAVHLLKWIDASTRYNQMRPFRYVHPLGDMIQLYHTAQELGMTAYLHGNLNWHRRAIMKGVPSQEDLQTVESLAATTAGERFVRIMADRIAFLVRHGQLPTGVDYMGMLAGFPTVHAAYLEWNKDWIAAQPAREEAARRKQQRDEHRRLKKENKRRPLTEAEIQNKREKRIAKEHEITQLRASLLPKVNRKIIRLTAEEYADAVYFRDVRRDPAFSMVV